MIQLNNATLININITRRERTRVQFYSRHRESRFESSCAMLGVKRWLERDSFSLMSDITAAPSAVYPLRDSKSDKGIFR